MRRQIRDLLMISAAILLVAAAVAIPFVRPSAEAQGTLAPTPTARVEPCDADYLLVGSQLDNMDSLGGTVFPGDKPVIIWAHDGLRDVHVSNGHYGESLHEPIGLKELSQVVYKDSTYRLIGYLEGTSDCEVEQELRVDVYEYPYVHHFEVWHVGPGSGDYVVSWDVIHADYVLVDYQASGSDEWTSVPEQVHLSAAASVTITGLTTFRLRVFLSDEVVIHFHTDRDLSEGV